MKLNKMKVYLVISLVLTFVLMIATPFMVSHENKFREVKTFGGEALLWLMPMFVYMIVKTIKEFND